MAGLGYNGDPAARTAENAAWRQAISVDPNPQDARARPLSRYRSYTPCPDCHGQRFQPEACSIKLPRRSALNAAIREKIRRDPRQNGSAIPNPKSPRGFYQLPVRDAFASSNNSPRATRKKIRSARPRPE